MRGHPLHIEQFGAYPSEKFDCMNQRRFRCIRLGVEHRLTGEHAANAESVDTSDQITGAISSLDRMGPALFVKAAVCTLDLSIDPSMGGGHHRRMHR